MANFIIDKLLLLIPDNKGQAILKNFMNRYYDLKPAIKYNLLVVPNNETK